MKISIIGCVYFNDYQILKWKLDELKVTQITTCGNNDIDKLAARYAIENNIKLVELWPEQGEGWYDLYRQYVKFIAICDLLLAFWYGENSNIPLIIKKAKRMEKQVTIVRGYHPGANIIKDLVD